MLYRINYVFNGYGKAFIEADSPEEARNKFDDGDFSGENEVYEDFDAVEVTEMLDS